MAVVAICVLYMSLRRSSFYKRKTYMFVKLTWKNSQVCLIKDNHVAVTQREHHPNNFSLRRFAHFLSKHTKANACALCYSIIRRLSMTKIFPSSIFEHGTSWSCKLKILTIVLASYFCCSYCQEKCSLKSLKHLSSTRKVKTALTGFWNVSIRNFCD